MLSLNCKNVQHVKIYLPCYFEVNPITHVGVISPFHQILEPPKDDSGQVWFELAQWFQRRRFFKKFTDRRRTTNAGRQVMAIAHLFKSGFFCLLSIFVELTIL
jgi:hypothetical protein